MGYFYRSKNGGFLGLPDIGGGGLASQEKRVNIWFGVKKEGRDEVKGEKKSNEGSVNVPVSKYLLNTRVKLLKDGGRVSGHS